MNEAAAMNSDYRMKKPPEKENVPSFAMAYVPYQQFGEIFSLSEAISKGTIFPELYKPFQKGACRNYE
ncbi:MAG: spore coat associated protein CotJA [Lachnospiraceae bacterium]|nr:spore coat associated protein CotJA [Lachnospiraceae bacterium]